MSIELALEESDILLFRREKKSYLSSYHHNTKPKNRRESRRKYPCPESRRMCSTIVKSREDLIRDEDSFFIRAIDRDLESDDR